MLLHESSYVNDDGLHEVYSCSMLGWFLNQVQSSLMWSAHSSEAAQVAFEDSPSCPKNHWQGAHLKANSR